MASSSSQESSCSQEIFLLYYKCRSPWQWVFEEAFEHILGKSSVSNCSQVSNPKQLPSAKVRQSTTGLQLHDSGEGNKIRRPPPGCTLRIEIVSSTSETFSNEDYAGSPVHVLFAAHGTSKVMEGLADKDEFVRTLTKKQCEHLAPPSLLIEWDASESFCRNHVQFPSLNGSSTTVAVLKTPLGSRGEGVFFISSVEELYEYLQQNYNRAVAEKGFVEMIRQSKRRIPSWVLQAEITPPMLIDGGKKFHLRSYVVVMERKDKRRNHDDFYDVYIYNRHEVRIAPMPFDEHDPALPTQQQSRNRRAHITNGASSDDTKRCLLHQVEELAAGDMQEKLERYVAQAFRSLLHPDTMQEQDEGNSADLLSCDSCIFAFAGVDIMLDENGRFYILEVNVNPAAPPKEVVDRTFHQHLVNLGVDLIRLVTRSDIIERIAPECTKKNFRRVSDILKQDAT